MLFRNTESIGQKISLTFRLILNIESFIMYSRITKHYDRKTVGHVFTKPVRIEGTIQIFFPPESCFSSYFTFLSLGDATVCSDKMAFPGLKSFCVLENHTSKSVVNVQHAFRTKYANDPPTYKIIRAWYKQFTESRCLCKQKSSGLPLTAEDYVERVRVTRGAHIEHL
jgi:hypothetical protein